MNKNMFTGDQMTRLIAAQRFRETASAGNLPHDQVVFNKARRARRNKGEGKHTRISRTTDGRKFTWHETKELPEDIKAKNRNKRKAVKKQKQKARKK